MTSKGTVLNTQRGLEGNREINHSERHRVSHTFSAEEYHLNVLTTREILFSSTTSTEDDYPEDHERNT